MILGILSKHKELKCKYSNYVLPNIAAIGVLIKSIQVYYNEKLKILFQIVPGVLRIILRCFEYIIKNFYQRLTEDLRIALCFD